MNKSSTPPTPVEVLPPESIEISTRLRKKLDAAPVQVKGTWESARHWMTSARQLQEAALFCQVMLGFELMALRDAMGVQRGGDRRSKSAPRAPLNFVAAATNEVGLSERSVWKFISMAEAAATRLRKLPELRGFDPATTSIAQLPDAQKAALSVAVQKMTDGLTQSDFLVELGLAKAPQGSGATGGARERKGPSEPVPADIQAEAERTFAREDFKIAMRRLEVSGVRFTLLTDAEIQEQIAWLELHIKARRQWMAKPQGSRKPDEIERMIRG